MAKTSKERVAEHRHNVYMDSQAHEKLKLKDRIRKQNTRKRIKHQGGLLAVKMRKKSTEYQKKWREGQRRLKQSLEVQNVESVPNVMACTPQSIGKAVRKVEKVMPKSPRKKAAIIGKMLANISPKKCKLIVKMAFMPRKVLQRKKRSDALTSEEVQQIQDYFRRDDISRMCPGRKDFVSVKTATGRELRQKRVLICNLHEVHEMFCEEINTKISFSMFCRLRPDEVVLTAQQGQEVCQCEYHENIEMCLEGLRRNFESLPKYAKDAVEMSVCSMENETCVDRKCKECGVWKLDKCFEECDDEIEVSYRKWTKGSIIKKELIETDIAEAKQDLYMQMEPFARHVYNLKRQHRELQYLKEHLENASIIVQEDFAENYTLRQQNEIMAAHWAPQQVTVFTAIIYYKSDGELKSASYAVVSSELEHNKESVYMFNKVILNDFVKNDSVKIDHIYYWTDGCGAQFKNKYTLSNLFHHSTDFGCTAEWNFFETAHGKGPVDGIGGSVKRSVWRCTMQGKDSPSDARAFFKIAEREAKSVRIIYVDKEDISKTIDSVGMNDRWASSKAIPGTRRFHHFKPSVNNDQLVCSINSPYATADGRLMEMNCETTINAVAQTDQATTSAAHQDDSTQNCISSGDYVLVAFKAKKTVRKFVGQVTEMRRTTENENEYNVLFMRKRDKTGYIFGFPERIDISWIMANQILQKFLQPTLHGRGLFKFQNPISDASD